MHQSEVNILVWLVLLCASQFAEQGSIVIHLIVISMAFHFHTIVHSDLVTRMLILLLLRQC